MSGGEIRVSQLRKRFGEVEALAGVDLAIAPGEIAGILGPNGAGKTTLISCLSTLLAPDDGTAVVAGHDVVRAPRAVRASIALTGQFSAVDARLTGRENLVFFGRLLGLSRKDAAARADELLVQFDLADAGDRLVSGYSGGMTRRLDLAATLICRRPVLFLDEPTTGLDPRSRFAVWNVVRTLRSEAVTILLTSQYLEEVDALADRIYVLDGGRVIASGTARELKRRVGSAVCHFSVADPSQLAAAAEAARTRAPHVLVDESRAALSVPAGDSGVQTLSELLAALAAAGVELEDAGIRQPSLDEVFLALTGKPASGTDADNDDVAAVQ